MRTTKNGPQRAADAALSSHSISVESEINSSGSELLFNELHV